MHPKQPGMNRMKPRGQMKSETMNKVNPCDESLHGGFCFTSEIRPQLQSTHQICSVVPLVNTYEHRMNSCLLTIERERERVRVRVRNLMLGG